MEVYLNMLLDFGWKYHKYNTKIKIILKLVVYSEISAKIKITGFKKTL